jgi:hypothetical protein
MDGAQGNGGRSFNGRGNVKDPNRDDALDPLLRQAARSLDGERPSGGCLEPDEVAAWADGNLRSSESARLETHAASCARCRAVMAAMVQTTPAADEARPAWWKAPVLRWAAPLAAVAAAAVIWVNVERGDPAEAPAGQVLMAPAEKQAPPVRDPTDPRPAQADSTANTQAAPPLDRLQPRARRESFEAKREDTGARAQATAKADPVPPPAAQAVPERSAAVARDAVAFSASRPFEVSSPDSSIRWRVRPGVAERSRDAGATWEAIPLPVQLPLTTGQCVTADVCWLAGAAGTVLRTTDGRTWLAVASPSAVDITSLSASGPLHATVTAADGRTFVTTDGGKTWR